MAGFPSIPIFLENKKALELSNSIYKESGCFPFLNPAKEIIVYHPPQKENPFYVIVCGLYALYHDFGGLALKWFLNNIPDPSLRVQMIQHKKMIETLRGYIAHGTYHSSGMQIIYSFFRTPPYLICKPIAQWSSQEWKIVCQYLTTESNELHSYLNNWMTVNQTTIEKEKRSFTSVLDSFHPNKELLRQCTEKVEMNRGNDPGNDIETKLRKVESELICSDLTQKMKNNRTGKTEDLFELIVNACDSILYPSSTSILMKHLRP